MRRVSAVVVALLLSIFSGYGGIRIYRAYQAPFSGFASLPDLPIGFQGDEGAAGKHVAATSARLHLVVAHYDEEPLYVRRWMNNVRAIRQAQDWGVHAFVYTKGVHGSGLQEDIGADTLVDLRNVGREGSTYLHHIIEHWDHLADYTLFAQADLHKGQREGSGTDAGMLRTWLDDRLRDQLNDQIGFMSLNGKHDLCYCGYCTDIGGRVLYPQWSQVYALLHGHICPQDKPNVVSFHAAFLVSRKRIRARGRPFYEHLRDLIDAPAEHWLHREGVATWFTKRKGPSTPSNPWFGHQLERLWHEIFDCGRLEDVVHCTPDLARAQGHGGCSCLDH